MAACFAQVSQRCRDRNGADAPELRWHTVSPRERFCHDCVRYYGCGEGRKVWQHEQQRAGGRSLPFKDLVQRLHLPTWVQCTRAGCGKWRALPPQTVVSELPADWHCGMASVQRSRSRAKSGSCDIAEPPDASLAAPSEAFTDPLPLLVPAEQDEALRRSVLEARLPWCAPPRRRRRQRRHTR